MTNHDSEADRDTIDDWRRTSSRPTGGASDPRRRSSRPGTRSGPTRSVSSSPRWSSMERFKPSGAVKVSPPRPGPARRHRRAPNRAGARGRPGDDDRTRASLGQSTDPATTTYTPPVREATAPEATGPIPASRVIATRRPGLRARGHDGRASRRAGPGYETDDPRLRDPGGAGAGRDGVRLQGPPSRPGPHRGPQGHPGR